MNNPSITDLIRAFDRELRRELNDRLPRRVGVIAVNHFNQNFRDAGWRDNGLHPWKETRRQREGTGAAAARTPLISSAPHLSRSIHAQPSPGQVRITNPVQYAAIHNYGGTINTHPSVTKKMRRFAWAKFYSIAKIKKGEKIPKDLPDEALKWRALALTKKSKLNITADIPQRQFIGDSAELRDKIDKVIIQTLQRISSIR